MRWHGNHLSSREGSATVKAGPSEEPQTSPLEPQQPSSRRWRCERLIRGPWAVYIAPAVLRCLAAVASPSPSPSRGSSSWRRNAPGSPCLLLLLLLLPQQRPGSAAGGGQGGSGAAHIASAAAAGPLRSAQVRARGRAAGLEGCGAAGLRAGPGRAVPE